LILRRFFLPISLRQRQLSGSNLPFSECTHQTLLHRFGCVFKLVAVHLNFCSKLVQNTTFLQSTPAVLLDFKPQSDPLSWYMALQGRMSDI
jgi:hypothetical protein